MERFDDKNSLKGGFFAISGAYVEFKKKKKRERKSSSELFMLQALSWFTIVQRHKRGCFCFLFFYYSMKMGSRLFCTDITEGTLKLSSCSWFILSL